MSLTIQRISPSCVIRSLLPKACGTFILRYPTTNDEIISSIQIENHPENNSRSNRYIILSVRVDETLYKTCIQYHRLPCLAESTHYSLEQLLQLYNQKKDKNDNRFTLLSKELIVQPEDDNWFLDKTYFQDIDFSRNQPAGVHNHGISTAIWQTDEQNDIKLFIKRFKKNNFYFQKESSLLKELCHFSVISFYGEYADHEFSYLVFENGGKSLESCCPLKFRSLKGKMKFIANVGFQIAYAMMYLENKNIVHRDLTASNVLINSYGFIRVADFGHAIKKKEGKNDLERSQTIDGEKRFQFRFLAPECLPDPKHKQTTKTNLNQAEIYARFSSKSDVWSYGILLVQLMLPDPTTPYPNITNVNNIPQYVKEERKIHPSPPGCHFDLYLILQQCWAYEPKNRIPFAQIRDRMKLLHTIFT